MISLDFTILPDLSESSAVLALDPDIQQALRAFHQTYDRAWGAMHFCYNIAGTEGTLRATKENFVRAREAHLRASLAEFASMEDALERDAHAAGTSLPLLRMRDLSDPLLHIIRELRNFEIHLHSSRLSSHDITAVMSGSYPREWSETVTKPAWCIQDLTPGDFANLRNARRYVPADVVHMLAWFNAAQKTWGIQELVRLAIIRYCRVIMGYYGLT
jgi:hypothetical protein